MNEKIILFEKKEKCCGCNACTQTCPKKAISMKEDEEGFLYPFIDRNRCIQCKLCEKVCPIKENSSSKSDNIEKCYIAYDKNWESRIVSSSGGLFYLFASWIIENEGIVVGAAFDEEWRVHHICIDNAYALEKLRGSKYLQSKISDTFKETKKYLDEGKKVLFSGVECQISGLKKYLGCDYENLYTIGVLCHGVPSPTIWKKYLEWQKDLHKSEIDSVCFRTKDKSWKNYKLQITFKNADMYKKEFYADRYMNLFLGDICLRPACHKCKFKRMERNADITLGDCWGIEKYMPEMDDDLGTSIAIIHSEKGILLWKKINEHVSYKEAELDKACPPSSDSRKSVMAHINRKKLFRKVKRGVEFEELYKCLEVTYIDRIKRKIKKGQKIFDMIKYYVRLKKV